MTHDEAVLVSAYTGYLLTKDFSDVHEFCEKILGRPIFTHEFGIEETQKEIQEKCKPMIIRMIEGEQHSEFKQTDFCSYGKQEGVKMGIIKTYEELYDKKGQYKTDSRYTEILKLDELLNKSNIPHTLHKMFDGFQILYPQCRERCNCVMDAIEHRGSYGSEKNLLEIQGLLTEEEQRNDSVLGFLTAEEVFKRIENHWNRKVDND